MSSSVAVKAEQNSAQRITCINTLHRLSVAISVYRVLCRRYDRGALLTDLAMAYDVPRQRLAVETLSKEENYAE